MVTGSNDPGHSAVATLVEPSVDVLQIHDLSRFHAVVGRNRSQDDKATAEPVHPRRFPRLAKDRRIVALTMRNKEGVVVHPSVFHQIVQDGGDGVVRHRIRRICEHKVETSGRMRSGKTLHRLHRGGRSALKPAGRKVGFDRLEQALVPLDEGNGVNASRECF